MKWYFFLVLVCKVYDGSAQPIIIQKEKFKQEIQKLLGRKARLLILTRGTRSKQNLISGMFNINDTNSTHVAIGIIRNKKIKVFSVEDRATGQSLVVFESINDFLFPADIFYTSIWIAKLRKKEIRAVDRMCRKYREKEIRFDYEFELKNGNQYYCSEFCAEILNLAVPTKFQIKPIEKEASGLFQKFLSRSIFRYFPVDFFQFSPYFKLKAEFTF